MLTPDFLAASMIALGLASSLLRDEAQRSIALRFTPFDRDGDGRLDRADLRALITALRQEKRRR